jgi:protein TonB
MHTLLKNIFVFTVIFLALSTITSAADITSTSPNSNTNEYLAFAEEMPAPIGGLGALYKKISYPELAKKARLEGKVFVLTFIDEKGEVTDVKVVKGIGGGCDEAACEAIKSSKFEPGKNQGKAVKVKLSLTINFKLK